ncbi:hypothetical protein AVEN_229195-1 [Araneus ventricosus]|uniref:Uncharacterized protein n=1 Tax=Araneus ventricosus TaxID=182803 RepID=A0A4Y2CHD5_ARAVE|nr:hypothetical protein AVEN_229195-1 [Araneus ventricosus]
MKGMQLVDLNLLGRDCDSLVVGSRPRETRVLASEQDSTEEPSCKRVWCTLNPSGPNVLPLVWKFGEGCQLGCRPRHLSAIQKYEVFPKNGSCVGSNWYVNITKFILFSTSAPNSCI